MVLYTKRDKGFNCQFVDCLKKHDFLQKTSNIDILYTIGKYFFPLVWIRYRYFKIRLYLARINWQSLSLLHKKVCRRSGHFCREWRVLLEQGGQEELFGTHLGYQNWPENGKRCRGATTFPRWLQLGGWEVVPHQFGILWCPSYVACRELTTVARWSRRGCFLCLERKGEEERESSWVKGRKRERESRRWAGGGFLKLPC